MSANLRQFEEIYQATKGAVFAYLRGQLACEHEREEAFQETWLTLVRRLEDLQPSHPRAYVLKIARSQVLKRHRAGKLKHCAPDSLLAPDTLSPELEDAHEAVAKLPPHHREVFTLRHHGGLTYEEIAEVLSIPPGTVASRLHLSIAELRRLLASPPQLVANDRPKSKS